MEYSFFPSWFLLVEKWVPKLFKKGKEIPILLELFSPFFHWTNHGAIGRLTSPQRQGTERIGSPIQNPKNPWSQCFPAWNDGMCWVTDLFLLKKKTPKMAFFDSKKEWKLWNFESSMEKSYLFKSKSAWFRLFSVKQTSQSQNPGEQIGSGEYGNDFVPMESSIKKIEIVQY